MPTCRLAMFSTGNQSVANAIYRGNTIYDPERWEEQDNEKKTKKRTILLLSFRPSVDLVLVRE